MTRAAPEPFDPITRPLSDVERATLALVECEPHATPEDVHAELGGALGDVQRRMRRMCVLGYLMRHGLARPVAEQTYTRTSQRVPDLKPARPIEPGATFTRTTDRFTLTRYVVRVVAGIVHFDQETTRPGRQVQRARVTRTFTSFQAWVLHADG